MFDYAAFFEVLAAGSAVFFALSFAANSCLTLAAMASVSSLYVLAASRSTVVGFDCEAASRMLVSTSSRESVPSSARRTKAARVFPTPNQPRIRTP